MKTGKKATTPDWKKEGLHKWRKHPSHKNYPFANTNKINRYQLESRYKEFLGDRQIQNWKGDKVLFKKIKANKFKDYSTTDVIGRMKYLNFIEPTLKKADEVWFDVAKKRYLYLRKYKTKTLLCLTEKEIKGETFFNFLIYRNEDNSINNKRKGKVIKR